ncbi:MAG: sugar phosphate isomerase/epimerase [Peptostreptococcaceae bacterium]|nr:sugar phosphate isomerase/epimerase [Peptostreptococcaceae bacterium]
MSQWKYSVACSDCIKEGQPLLIEGSLEEVLVKAAKLGYDAIEYHTCEDANFDIDRINKIKTENKIEISAIVTGRLATMGKSTLLSESRSDSKAALEGLLKYIDLAKALNTNIIIGWAKGNIPDNEQKKYYFDKLSKLFSQICKYAKKSEVKVLVEEINRYETNLFNTADQFLDFINKYKIDNCYAHLDTFHMNIEESSLVEAIKKTGNKLGYLHVADNNRKIPGNGSINFSEIFNTLKQVQYTGYVSVECLPGEDGVKTANKALIYLKQIDRVLNYGGII